MEQAQTKEQVEQEMQLWQERKAHLVTQGELLRAHSQLLLVNSQECERRLNDLSQRLQALQPAPEANPDAAAPL